MDSKEISVEETAKIISTKEATANILPLNTSPENSRLFANNTRSTLAQCFATYVNGLCFMNIGLLASAPSVVIANIQDLALTDIQDLALTDDQISWYSSLLPLSQPFGCFVGGLLQNYIGRKYGLLLTNASTVIAWLTLYKAGSVFELDASSILMGISMGLAQTPCVTYVCEIATPKLRGTLVTYNDSNAVIGTMVIYLLAVFFDWRTSALVCMVFPIIASILVSFIPDSPVWLIGKGRTRQATKALQWLRGWVPEEQVMPEVEELRHFILKRSYSEGKEQGENSNSTGKERMRFRDLLDGDTLRPFVLLCLYSFFMWAVSTQGARNYYLVLLNSLNLPVKSERLAFLYSTAMLIGGVVCSATVKKLGKRTLSLATMISCSILTSSLGFYIFFERSLQQPSVFIVLFILLGFTQTVGISTIPWVLMGEVFPVRTRSVAVGLSGAAYLMCMAIYVKTYHLLSATRATFIIYGALGIVGSMYLWIFMPETEGKSMAEIEELFAADARKNCTHFRKKKK